MNRNIFDAFEGLQWQQLIDLSFQYHLVVQDSILLSLRSEKLKELSVSLKQFDIGPQAILKAVKYENIKFISFYLDRIGNNFHRGKGKKVEGHVNSH